MNTVKKMRLSKETYNILKNFASINSNIVITPGNTIRTKSAGDNLYAEAKISEDFDVQVAIWDLNRFLGIVSMFENPDLEFSDTHVTVSNGRSSVIYYYSQVSLLSYPKKTLKMPKTTVKFDLAEQDLYDILKASSILQADELSIEAENGKISISVGDSSQSSSDKFNIEIMSDDIEKDYSGKLKVSDIKIIPGSYTVELTDTVVSKFTHKNLDIYYNIAIKRG